MKKDLILPALILFITLTHMSNLNKSFKVLGYSTSAFKDEKPISQLNNTEINTISSFEEKEISEEEAIPFGKIYQNNPDIELGTEEVIQEGKDGKIVRTYLASFWYGEETQRTLTKTEVTNAKPEMISEGTKIVWRKVATMGEKNIDDSDLSYWKRIENVWATSYDKSCYGCNEWTALGTKLDYGTCAVDPKVIKLWTKIYVPGYGTCYALDVGGSIKGNKIDVGFYDLHAQSEEVGWRGAHYTTIYLLDNEPTD